MSSCCAQLSPNTIRLPTATLLHSIAEIRPPEGSKHSLASSTQASGAAEFDVEHDLRYEAATEFSVSGKKIVVLLHFQTNAVTTALLSWSPEA